MITQAQFLSADEQQVIHEDSLKILWEVGALFHSDRALDLLAKSGAHVERDSKVARIPKEMVDILLTFIPASLAPVQL